MKASEIITDIFELYLDDTTEMSSDEELALLNRIYKKICRNRPWEFLKKTASGSVLSSGTTYYITIPTDFSSFAENNQSTDNSVSVNNNSSPKVIFIGTSLRPYQIVNFSDRRQYANKNGFAYLDLANNKIVFTAQPDSLTYEFDYIKVPTTLTANDDPILPEDFHPMIGFGMAVDGFIMQLFDKARSYAVENQGKYNDYLKDLAYYNSQLLLN
jgi:hypothetical protein